MSILSILSKNEQEKFVAEPTFTLQEKKYFFKVPELLLLDLNSSKNKVIMTLLWGYFKATNRFYVDFKQKSNIEFVVSLYNYECKNIQFSSTTLYRYKEKIKQYLKINEYTDEIKSILQKEANNLANNFIHRKKIFYTLVNLSRKLNIEMPSYTELTRIIQVALNTQKQDILEKLEPLLKDKRLKVLDEFLEKDKESKNRYKIAYFRRLEHSTAKKQMMLSLGKLNTMQSKFNILKEIISEVGITPKLGKIIKTDFLLNYIDDVTLRQRIEKQLNKVEASNKFSKAVFFGNSSEFTVATAEEQNIANNSKRLIQNAIILWNYLYITKKLQQASNENEKEEILNALKNSSIIYWNFINDFTRSSKRIHRLIALD
jgi:hypothetical protein